MESASDVGGLLIFGTVLNYCGCLCAPGELLDWRRDAPIPLLSVENTKERFSIQRGATYLGSQNGFKSRIDEMSI